MKKRWIRNFNIGQNFRQTKFFVGQKWRNFSWKMKILSNIFLSDKVLILLLFLILKKFWREKCWMFTFEKKRKNVPVDLNNDLKEGPDLRSRCCFTPFGPLVQGSWILPNLLKYARMWANISRYVWLCKYAWICLEYCRPK